MDVIKQNDEESMKPKQDGGESITHKQDGGESMKLTPSLGMKHLAKENSCSCDEFEAYAVEVEKEIRSERRLTLMRLSYISQLRTPTRSSHNKVDCIAKLVLPSSEDTTDSDSSIMLSAMQDCNVSLIKKFLTELKPQRRRELLVSRLGAKYGATYLQLALEAGNAELFRELRIFMDKDTKRTVTQSKDNIGNCALHDACSGNDLFFAQSLLANFKKHERPALIMSENNKGNSCLRLAATTSNSEIFTLLMKQFDDKEILWECIMTVNNYGDTLGHVLAAKSNFETHLMFRVLCELAIRSDKVEEFIFQRCCPSTLLHSLVSNADITAETVEYSLTNLKVLFELAEMAGRTKDLVWKRRDNEENAPALYYLASLKKQSKHIKPICDFLLSQLGDEERVDYIMAEEQKSGQNSLHAAAYSNNLAVLQSFIKNIPYKEHLDHFLLPSKIGGSTPLHLAASQAVLTFKEILTNFDSNERQRLILTTDCHGNTPILIAFIEGNIDVVNSLMSEKWLPRRMIFPLMSARNGFGWTIIHLSCIRIMGDFLTVSVLTFFKNLIAVNLNAMLHHQDHNGNTVMHLAALLYRPKVAQAIMEHIRTDKRNFLLKRNKDGLVASQLCNMPDIVVVKYLEPLIELGWTNEALIAKRDTLEFKHETQRKIKSLEEANRITPTPIDIEDVETSDYDDDDWDFDYTL